MVPAVPGSGGVTPELLLHSIPAGRDLFEEVPTQRVDPRGQSFALEQGPGMPGDVVDIEQRALHRGIALKDVCEKAPTAAADI